MPVPTYRDQPATLAVDVSGVGLGGEPVDVRLVTGRWTLLLFLSTGCQGCHQIWEVMADPVGNGLVTDELVVADHPRPRPQDLAALARSSRPDIPVVMSSAAWAAYRVQGPPFFALVDGSDTGVARVRWSGWPPKGWPGVRRRSPTTSAGPVVGRREVRQAVDSRLFDIETDERRVTDLTGIVVEFCAGRGDGLCHVFAPHATAGLALMELGSGSEADLAQLLDRLLPRDDRYRHRHGSIGHGADHLLPVLVSPSLSLPVADGELLLGTWQSVVLVDPNVDNRHRQVRCSWLPAAT